MDAPAQTLILTKLRPPASRPGTIDRARLLGRLSLSAAADLLLVTAPAGYGKTTLLVEWTRQLRQAGRAVAWYSLDEGDDTPAVFGAYLVTALAGQLEPENILDPVIQALRSTPEIDLLRLLPAVVNAVLTSGRELELVLDDYHLMHAPAIHQAVEFLINHRPHNLRLTIGSRNNPPLPLARLRARGRLVELGASDLRFTAEETARFLQETMRLDLAVGDAERLADQVEGWAAGLQLSAISLAGRAPQESAITSFTGSHRQLADYLLDEVVNRLPEELQAFLLYTSILERLSAPLCDAILGSGDSAGRLQQLEQANLFLVALDEEGTWYRYHHLFRDFLRAWLISTQPRRAAELHRAACAWLAAQGWLREAALHAFQCGDWNFAANFVELHSFNLIIRSEIAVIYEWCAALPEAIIQKRPLLCVFQALALAYQFRTASRARIESRLEQSRGLAATLGASPDARTVDELSAVVRTFLAMTPDPRVDAHKLLVMAENYLAAYPPGDTARFTWLLASGYSLLALQRPTEAESALIAALPLAFGAGLFFGVVETTFHRARLAHSQARLVDALRICRETQDALAPTLRGTNLALPALGCLDIVMGDVLLEQDRLEEADEHLRRGLERMGWGMNPYYLMTGWLARFRLCQAQGRPEEALGCLDQLDLVWPDIQFFTTGLRLSLEWTTSRLVKNSGMPEIAEQTASADPNISAWLQAYLISVGGELPLAGLGPVGAGEVYFQANLLWSQLQMDICDPRAALPWLDKQLALCRAQGIAGRAIQILLILAQAYHRLDQDELARQVLENALDLGQNAGYRRSFDQPSMINGLIQSAVKQGYHQSYAGQVLASIRTARARSSSQPELRSSANVHAMTPVPQELLEPLSPRELDVLRLVASGATNQEIAERLVITVGTVKSHINHLLAKLGAGNRIEAVIQGKKRGLIAGG